MLKLSKNNSDYINIKKFYHFNNIYLNRNNGHFIKIFRFKHC